MKAIKIMIFILICFALPAHGQIDVSEIKPDKFPKGIKYEGKIKSSFSWEDSIEGHLIILTETGIVANKSEQDFNDAYLYAYHYTIQNDSAKLIWRIYDFIKECNVDLEASFIRNTFQVTDLDKNGVTEIWIMYRTVCHGDVSPMNMKIIMYEGDQKYAMRGKNKVQVSDKEFAGGEFAFDDAFKNGPKSFRDFAQNLWNKNLLYKWE